MRRMVLAPHMDDESLGCGGLIAKQPDDALVVVVTDSGPVREAEHERALAALGVGDSIRLGLPDGRVEHYMTDLVSQFDALLSEHRPDEVYLPFPSLHQDHIAVYEAGMRSCRISMSVDHWVPSGVLVYDIAVYDVNLYPSDLRWNVFEELDEEHVAAKAAACAAYSSEIPTEAHPMGSVRELAAAAGRTRLLRYAEQFALVRQVRR